jgi:hypothetical protein
MTRLNRSLLVASMTMIGAVCLVGCSQSAPDLPTLEREQAAQDVLPNEILDGLSSGDQGVDGDSTRFAGELSGTQVFVARANEATELCLIIVATPEDWTSGCSDSTGLEVHLGESFVAAFTVDGVIPADDQMWVALNDDVIALIPESSSN